jgi:glutamate 5-kinase
VAAATEADILIIMSDIDGLYNKNPKEYDDAVLISDVTEITEEIEKNAGGAGSSVGTGGMATKLQAAKLCMKFGIEMYIVNGKSIDNKKEHSTTSKEGFYDRTAHCRSNGM